MRYLVLLLLFACSHVENPVQNYAEPKVPAVASPDEGAPSEFIGPEYPVANVKKIFTVKIATEKYSDKQNAKVKEAAKLIAAIFNSKEYKEAVLNHVYGGKKAFADTDLGNDKIYEKLFAGAEGFQPALNYQMDLTLVMYYERWTKVVGWTSPELSVVYTNSKFHDSFDACRVASNVTHEWTHKVGFGHSSAKSYESVPYAHNSIIEMLCPLAQQGKLSPL